MAGNEMHEAATALKNDWDLQLPENISEDVILRVLTNRIIMLLERGSETFFQLMYRLDVSEKKLKAVLNESDAPAHIARLVYDRQLQKIITRRLFQKENNADPDLQW